MGNGEPFPSSRPSSATDQRKRTVAEGYDALAVRWLAWRNSIEGDPRWRFLDDLRSVLSDGARVLDLGCGPGEPRLAEGFELVGVDISREQVALARDRVPTATFLQADMTELDFEPGSFDAVTALCSLTHLPREELGPFLARVAVWLRPRGLLLAALGSEDVEGWTGDWLGTTMFFSHYDADANRRLVREAGFKLLRDELVTMREPEGDATFLWTIAEKED